MRLRNQRLGVNSRNPIKTLAALIAAIFATTAAQSFDWTASDLASQYQDSSGENPVTAVEQPAAIILDRAKGGASRSADRWQAGPVVLSGLAQQLRPNVFRLYSTDASLTAISVANILTVGKYYEATFNIDSITTAGAGLTIDQNGTNVFIPPGVGYKRIVFLCTYHWFMIKRASSAVDQQISNLQVREINGVNAWSGAPNITGSGAWTDNGDGSYTCAGVNGLLGYSTPKIIPGRTYECIMRVSSRTAGSVALPYDGTGANIIYKTTTGTFRRILVAPANASLYIYSNGFAGTVDFISVVEIPGNHLIQPTSASRPTLSARVNLLTYSEQISHANWTKTAGGTGTTPVVTDNFGVAPDGTTTAARLQMSINGGTTSADISRITQLVTGMPVGGTYTQGVWLKTNDGSTRVVQFRDDNAGTVGKNITVTGTWQYFSQDSTVSAGLTTVNAVGLWVRGTLGTADSVDLLMWHPQFNIGPPTRYQRIGAATDYDSVGFAKGWRFDGVDDGMYSTAPVDFSGTNKVTLVAALLKMSDSAFAYPVELTASAASNNGAFYLLTSASSTANFSFGSKGTSLVGATSPNAFPAPITAVLTGQSDISAPLATLRVNGNVVGTNAVTQGTGNYSNSVVYVGRRGGASNPFLGTIYSLRAVGRRVSPDELGWLEAQAKLDMNNSL